RLLGPLMRRSLATGQGGQQRSLKSYVSAPLRLLKSLGPRAIRRAFRVVAQREAFDLYHEPNYIPWACDVPAVATVPDPSVLLHPDWHPPERVRFYERHFFRNLHRCRRLIADSEAIRRELIERLGIPAERIATVHLGVRPVFRPMSEAEAVPALRAFGLSPG